MFVPRFVVNLLRPKPQLKHCTCSLCGERYWLTQIESRYYAAHREQFTGQCWSCRMAARVEAERRVVGG